MDVRDAGCDSQLKQTQHMVPAASAKDGAGPARSQAALEAQQALPAVSCWVLPISSLLGEHNLPLVLSRLGFLLVLSVWKWHLLAAVGERHQQDGSGREKALAGKRLWLVQLPWAGPAGEAQRVQQSTRMGSSGLSPPLPVTDSIPLLSLLKQNASWWRFCTLSTCPCL